MNASFSSSSRFLLLPLLSLFSGCGQSHLGATSDAGRPRVEDAGSLPTLPDAGPVAAPDASLTGEAAALAEALTCGLTHDEALGAAVRVFACDGPGWPMWVSASQLVEMWEVGLSSGIDGNTGGALASCQTMQAAAAATSCADLQARLSGVGVPGPCEPTVLSCDGSQLMQCAPDGSRFQPILDCAPLGAVCEGAGCRRLDCFFGPFEYGNPRCDGADLVLCGAIRLNCGTWQPGTTCRSVAVGGEAPSDWCAPAGALSYGVYGGTVTCATGAIEFTSFSGRRYHYDCLAHGYSGCNSQGCVP